MLSIWAKHIVDTCNGGQIEISEDGITAAFNHPGMCYRHFDRDGNPHVVDTMLFLNELRNISLLAHNGPNGTNHLDFLELFKGRLIFVMSTEFEMTREFYDRTTPKWPIKVTNSLGQAGNSSLTINVKMSNPNNDAPLVTLTSCYALVDRETRRSKPFPDWYKLKYGGKGVNTRPCRVETLHKPIETFHSQKTVMWTDTDKNNHTNFSTYVQFTINALRAALLLRTQQQTVNDNDHKNTVAPQAMAETSTSTEGSTAKTVSNTIRGLRGISQDIVRSGVKSLRVCYTKESAEGDVIDVHIWQDKGDDLRVKAVLEREGDALCHVYLEYFGTVASQL